MKKLNNIIPKNYIEKLKTLKKLQEELKELEKTFKTDLKDKMYLNNIKNLELDGVRFSYVNGYDKTELDAAKLAAEHPTIYKKYVVKKAVASTLKTTILKEED